MKILKRTKVLVFLSIVTWPTAVQAHTIGGAYAHLEKCEWGQYGYEYGWIGTYDVNGQTIVQFFGSKYCPA